MDATGIVAWVNQIIRIHKRQKLPARMCGADIAHVCQTAVRDINNLKRRIFCAQLRQLLYAFRICAAVVDKDDFIVVVFNLQQILHRLLDCASQIIVRNHNGKHPRDTAVNRIRQRCFRLRVQERVCGMRLCVFQYRVIKSRAHFRVFFHAAH